VRLKVASRMAMRSTASAASDPLPSKKFAMTTKASDSWSRVRT
jgi:hypothetical protein